jgi:hypothetical protein
MQVKREPGLTRLATLACALHIFCLNKVDECAISSLLSFGSDDLGSILVSLFCNVYLGLTC